MPAEQQQTMQGGSGIREVLAGILDRPAELVLDLPPPTSVNRTMATKLGGRHWIVQAWRRDANAYLLATKQSKHLHLIKGDIFAEIIWGIQNRSDIDNRIKHLLDYLQLLGVVTNDNQIRSMYIHDGITPAGCRIRLWQADRRG